MKKAKTRHTVLGVITGIILGLIFGLGGSIAALFIAADAKEKREAEEREARRTEDYTEELTEDYTEGGTSDSTEVNGKYPTAGIYLFIGFGDENGELIPEENWHEDTFDAGGYEKYDNMNVIDYYIEQNRPMYFDINEDGTGTFHGRIGNSEDNVTFVDETTLKLDEKEYSFSFNETKIWYEDASNDHWPIFEVSTQDAVDRYLEGKGGTVAISEAGIGDIISLGTYEQNGMEADGMEPMRWKVLDIQDGKMLVIADRVIDSYCYNKTDSAEQTPGMTWQDCSVRQFLNGDFLDTCFTPEEAALIQTTHLTNPSSSDFLNDYWGGYDAPYDVLGNQIHTDGPETNDKIFLLSVEEVLKYMGDEDDYCPSDSYPFNMMVGASCRSVKCSTAVRHTGNVYYESQTSDGCWMTRTLSDPNEAVVYLTSNGSFFNWYSNQVGLGLRPAMWISIE